MTGKRRASQGALRTPSSKDRADLPEGSLHTDPTPCLQCIE